mgnify:CR=1 FL=1|jgi:hypothetical protein
MKEFKNYRTYLFIALLTGSALFSSCKDDADSSNENANTNSSINFNVSVDNDWYGNTSTGALSRAYAIAGEGQNHDIQLTGASEKGINAETPVCAAATSASTRATMIGSANFYTSFNLYGLGDNGVLSVQKGDDGRYVSNGVPSATASVVTAIAPQNSAEYHDGNVQVALDGDVADQQDVMVATDTVKANGNSMDLNFRHILAAVNFKIGKLGFADHVKVNSIAIEGVYTQGSYNVEQDAWTVGAVGNENVDLSTVIGSTDVDLQENVMLTSGSAGNTLMLIPQTTPAGAKILVSLTYNNANHTISFPFGNQTLSQGYTVTLGIGSGSDEYGGYALSVTNPSNIFSWRGGDTQNIIVKSYKNDASKTSVAWSVDGFSEDGGSTWTTQVPDGLVFDSYSGDGGQEGQYVRATLNSPAEGTNYVAVMRAQMRANAAVSDYDLSLHDVSGARIERSTANTYVVRAGGTYLIPLVVGNTITNGKTHIFTGRYADTFVNWKGQQVTAANYKITEATGAKMLWCDAGDNILSNLSIVDGDDGLKFLRFNVSRDNIAPGNALLAVTDQNGNVIWSWQIWLTGADLSYTIPVRYRQNSKTYQFSPLPLGSTGNGMRRILVRIRQNDSGKTAIVTLNQMVSAGSNESPYYQWGRKDPMPRSYDISGFSHQATKASLSQAIMNPNVFYHNSKNWCSDFHADLWSTGRNGFGAWEQNGKTIYDPSPVGYKVPAAAAWSFINGDMLYEGDAYGYWFYTSSCKSAGQLIYIPRGGYIDSGSANITNGNYAVYWSSDNQSITNANAEAKGILVYPSTTETIDIVMARGCTILPILDTDELSYPASSNWK